jgi:hypothetical protein
MRPYSELVPVAERRREHPEEPVGCAVAGDDVADHHVASLVEHQLGIQQRGGRLVAERRARLR